jgi:predicted pyridoxine 5'-phosphate oxidase superfamily flavin-nucleotide-binding protein
MQATNADLPALDALIAKSARTATPAAAESVAYAGRQMSAAELIEFWQNVSLIAMATVGKRGQPHIAPVHARLDGVRLRLVIYDNAVRRRDLAANPRVAFTTWSAGGAVAILYGLAREVPQSRRAARPGRSGKQRFVIEVEVELTRVYAMRAPQRQP